MNERSGGYSRFFCSAVDRGIRGPYGVGEQLTLLYATVVAASTRDCLYSDLFWFSCRSRFVVLSVSICPCICLPVPARTNMLVSSCVSCRPTNWLVRLWLPFPCQWWFCLAVPFCTTPQQSSITDLVLLAGYSPRGPAANLSLAPICLLPTLHPS